MNKFIKLAVTGAASAALLFGVSVPAAQAQPVGDLTGQETYVPTPTFIDDCGTSKDKILVSNTSKLNWWVYKNADGTNTATVYPKTGYWIDAYEYDAEGNIIGGENETVFDFPAFTDTCIWIESIPAPTRYGTGDYDITLPKVSGGSWRMMKVTGGTKVWLQPKIGYGIPTGVQSSWVL